MLKKTKEEMDNYREAAPSEAEAEGEPREDSEQNAEVQEKGEELTKEQLEKARENIEKTDVDDSAKLQADSQAQDIKMLDEEKKIKKLVELVQSKGVVFSVLVAKKMGDPFVLDALHDFLAKGGHYKEFLK